MMLRTPSKLILLLLLLLSPSLMSLPLAGKPEHPLAGAYFRYELRQLGFRETSEAESVKRRFKDLFGRVPSIVMRLSLWDLAMLSSWAADTFTAVGNAYIGADRVVVELRVLGWEERRCIVNYSVTFDNFSLYCFGEFCGPLDAFPSS